MDSGISQLYIRNYIMARDLKYIRMRNAKIKEEYKKMYDIQRKRHDDVIQALADMFFLAPATISKILFKKEKKVN